MTRTMSHENVSHPQICGNSLTTVPHNPVTTPRSMSKESQNKTGKIYNNEEDFLLDNMSKDEAYKEYVPATYTQDHIIFQLRRVLCA